MSNPNPLPLEYTTWGARMREGVIQRARMPEGVIQGVIHHLGGQNA